MIKNKMAGRLALYFFALLLLFSLVISVVFFMLFNAQNINSHKQDLLSHAQSIAQTLSDFDEDTAGSGSGSGGRGYGKGNTGNGSGNTGGGYGAYLRALNGLTSADIWVVDQNRDLVTSGQGGYTYTYKELPQDALVMVDNVFLGQTPVSQNFSSVLQTPTLTVGAPIKDDNGAVVGAVLLHSPVSATQAPLAQGLTILAYSLAVALVLALLLSWWLSLGFTKPLHKIRHNALLLASGHYDIEPTLLRDDEIGELASTMQTLAQRLDSANKQSQQLEQMRNDFVANISHELKTPVTVLRGSLLALTENVVTDGERVHEYHQQMLNETLMLERLVTDLLDLSKLQHPDFALQNEKISLCDVLDDAVRSANQMAQKKHVTLTLNKQDPLCCVQGDYGRLRQMFLIVLDNAIKFSPENGLVNIDFTANTLTVTDQGPGIAPESIPYLFDRFYKSNSKQNASGSGLGLAIAKQIAERHGVLLSAKNAPQSGAQFIFVFK